MSDRPGGIFAASITPVDEDGRVDVPRLLGHLRWLLQRGCHGVAMFGTTGEATSFPVAERRRVLEAVVEAGIDPQRLMVGVGCTNRDDTLELARHARGLGVTDLLMLPPFFYKNVPDEGLHRAFAEVLDGLDDGARLVLYHIPQVSGVPVTFPVIERLRRRDPVRVAGIKDSSGDLDHTLRLIDTFPGLAVFSGSDRHLLDNLRRGGAGVITAGNNLVADWSRRVWDAHRAGRAAEAEHWMAKVATVRAILESRPVIPALKAVLAAVRRDPAFERVRPPLVELPASAREELLAELDAAGFTYEPADFTAVAD